MGQSKTRTKGIYTEADGSKTINKTWKGERINKRLGQVSQSEAEDWLRDEINIRQEAIERAKNARFLFADCAKRYLEESMNKSSVQTIAYHIDLLLPYIGGLEIELIHDGTLQDFITKRINDGVSHTTVNRSIEVVVTVLNKAARVYRDHDGRPWLKQAVPQISRLNESRRKPRPINFDEQEALISELPAHLVPMTIFGVNTGLRNGNISGLVWEWERFIPELNRSVFEIPPSAHKSGSRTNRSHIVILNDLAWKIVNEQRGKHKKYVFVYHNKRVKPATTSRLCTMYTSAWKSAAKRAGLPGLHVHDLRHTYGNRLRASNASAEDRGALLGHATKLMTDHYALPHLESLIKISNKVVDKTTCGTIINLI